MSEHENALRSEIIESQKTQAEFLKWKLIATAAVASIAFGINQGEGGHEGRPFLLCLVPLICAYVDLTSLHIMIRIIIIGSYLKAKGNDYERFVFNIRQAKITGPYVFEAVALHGSSLVFNIIIVVLGFCSKEDLRWPYIGTGAAGVVITCVLWLWYTVRARDVARRDAV